MRESFNSTDGGPFRFSTPNNLNGHNAADRQEENYPLDAFPENVSQMIQDVAKETQTPDSLGGALALGIISGCIGKGLAISDAANGNDGLPILQIMIFMASGGGKSSVMRKLTKPLYNWTSQMEKEHKNKESKIRAQEKCLEVELEKVLLDHKKNPSERLQNKAAELQSEIDGLKRQKTPTTYLVEDVTEERLAVLLGRNGETGAEAIFSISADARKPLKTLLGRYSKGDVGDGPYLNGFSGDPCNVQRQDSDRSVDLKAPFVALTWVMQPDLATKLLEHEDLMVSGFIPRQIMEKCHKTRVLVSSPVKGDPQIRKGWDSLIFNVLEKFRVLNEPIRIDATPEARKLLLDYRNDVEMRIISGELADIASEAARWAEQAWRIALVLHVARHGNQAGAIPVEVTSATNGIRLARYYQNRKLGLLFAGRERIEDNRRGRVFDLAKRLGFVTPSRCAQYLHEYSADEWRGWLEKNIESFEFIPVKTKGGGPTSEQYHLKEHQPPSNASHARNARNARNEKMHELPKSGSYDDPSIISVPSVGSTPSATSL